MLNLLDVLCTKAQHHSVCEHVYGFIIPWHVFVLLSNTVAAGKYGSDNSTTEQSFALKSKRFVFCKAGMCISIFVSICFNKQTLIQVC